MINLIDLQRFDGSGSAGSGTSGTGAGTAAGGQTGNAGHFTYEQLDEIANSRAEKASRAALADFFRKQGMTEDEITTAINDFKHKKAENQPNISAIEQERDTYRQELQDYKNKEVLNKLNVGAEYIDFVLFKVNNMVTDKLPFDKAAEQFIKENPKYAGASSTYKVSTGVSNGGSAEGTGSKNEDINNKIRAAFGRG